MAALDEYRPKQSRAVATVNSLLDAAIEEIETLGEDGVRVETVLEKAGVSIGSLYHHFGGREQLIEAARVEQLRRFHNQDLADIQDFIQGITSVEDLTERLRVLSESYLDPHGGDTRLQRLALLGSAVTREALLATTREARQRTNAILVEAFQDLKDRKILSEAADPVAISLFLQAIGFGQVLADIDDVRPDPEYWNKLVHQLTLMVMHLAPPA